MQLSILMKIGYIRISTQDQNYNLQEDALNKLGCEMIFKETVSGATKERPQLKKLLEQIRKGDVVVVYKLDRLGRSLKHLLEIVEILNSKNVALQSLHDNIDTTTPQGRLFFNISASFLPPKTIYSIFLIFARERMHFREMISSRLERG